MASDSQRQRGAGKRRPRPKMIEEFRAAQQGRRLVQVGIASMETVPRAAQPG
jgi:hypothetical protein